MAELSEHLKALMAEYDLPDCKKVTGFICLDEVEKKLNDRPGIEGITRMNGYDLTDEERFVSYYALSKRWNAETRLNFKKDYLGIS